MDYVKGKLYFKNISDIKYKYNTLTKDVKCDVLVIGAGITGALTAYYHAIKGHKVVIIDKNIVGYSSTLATTAIMEYQVDKDIYKLKKEIGYKNAIKIFSLCNDAIDEIEKICKMLPSNINFKRCDSIYFTNKRSHIKNLEKEYNERLSLDMDLSIGVSNNVINSKKYISAHNKSATMNPYIFTSELINYLCENYNVCVYENTEFKDYICNNDNIVIKTNNNFYINSKKCIIATGFNARKFVKNVKYYNTYTIVSDNVDIKNTNFTARDMNNPYHYIRFDNKKIILGGEDVLENSIVFPKMKYKKLENYMKKIFNLKDIKINYRYNGTFANTKDTLPIIDLIDNNLYCNLGYGANGILYATIGAKLLSSNKLDSIFKNR